MNIVLTRRPSADGWTQGQLSCDGVHSCYTCEDVIRPGGEKVLGQTAIPAGKYQVIITDSPRFARRLPILLAVPDFSGIRIHPGNSARDTKGCILPGRGITPAGVTHSVLAFDVLFARIDSALIVGEEVWIDVRNAG